MISIVKKYLILTSKGNPSVILLVLMMCLSTFSEASRTKITTEIEPPCTIPVTGNNPIFYCGEETSVTLVASTYGSSYGSSINHYWYYESTGEEEPFATIEAPATPPAPNTQVYTSSIQVSNITTTKSYWIATCTDGTRVENKITINPPPIAGINTNGDIPIDVCPGSGFKISSTITSSSYQWYKNGISISEADGVDYEPDVDGFYKVKIMDATCGELTSSEVEVTFTSEINNTASIGGDNHICLGDLAEFTATRNASLPLSVVDYQWKLDGVNVGTDSPTYSSSSLEDGQNVTCTITINNSTTCASPTSVTSNIKTMVVTDPNTIPLSVMNKTLNCGSETVNLYTSTASTSYTGLQHYWYDNETGGTATPLTPSVMGNPEVVTSSLSVTPLASRSYWVSAFYKDCESSPRKELVVTVNPPPIVGIITNGVTPYNVCPGSGFTISCTTTGSSSYQWYKNGAVISGSEATYADYEPDVDGFYKVKIMDATCGELTSSEVEVTFTSEINNTASIGGDNHICLGDLAEFTATRNASLTLSEVDYQWKKNGLNVGTDSPTFASSSLADGEVITCTITINNSTTCASPTSVTSNIKTMVVTDPNTIPLSVMNKTLNCGSETVNLYTSTASTSYTELQHYWYDNETGGTATPLTPSVMGNPEVVTSSLSVTPLASRSYWVSAFYKDCESSPREELVVTVNPPPIASIITDGVSSYDVCIEDNFYIRCTTTGSINQWYKDGAAISGATNVDYYYPTTTGDYTVKIIDATCGELTSGIIPVTVVDYTATPILDFTDTVIIASTDTPKLITASLIGDIGSNFTYTYQWKKDGEDIAGETNNTYEVISDGSYTVDVWYGGCLKTSGELNLHINLLPIAIAGDDIALTLAYGLNVTLDGSASYDPDGTIVSYSWSEVSNKNVLIEGANTATPTLSNFTAGGDYEFSLTVTDNFGENSIPDNIIVRVSDENNYNWVKATTVLTKDVKNAADVIANEKSIQWDYFDGLGRPMQSVSVGNSPDGKDVVQPIIYDEFGRQTLTYLPYADNNAMDGYYKTTAISDQYNFYQSTGDKIVDDTRPFSEAIFEPSPLNRVIQQYGAGVDWNDGVDIDRPVRYNYEVNALDEVLFWVVSGDMPISETPNEYYDPGELFKNITIDEENHEVITFVDKQGRTILKRIQAPDDGDANTADWADTYYVYDDFGNLRFVLPPEAVRLMTE